MKRGFVRALWGIYDHQGRRLYKRRTKMDYDIKVLTHNKYSEPFITFVFGEDNYKYLTEEVGLNPSTVRLADKRPIVWDIDKEGMRHKTEAFKLGMEEFDEMVFLDFDTQPIKPLPLDFWEVLAKKERIQAILRCYKKRKISWREQDCNRIPCASFVYIRDKTVPASLIKTWEEMGRPWSEEICMVKYMEGLVGGWQGIDKYWELFEPDFFVLGEGQVYSHEKLATKNHCFSHFNINAIGTQLRMIDQNSGYEWLKYDDTLNIPVNNRTEIINHYLTNEIKQTSKNYLEIGVAGGGNFARIRADVKDGVDPNPSSGANLKITSDDFFKNNKTKYDVIFIDGLHQHKQVYRDIINSLNTLRDGGYIIVHDCNPPSEHCQTEEFHKGYWNGTVWKAFVQLRMERDDLEMFVVDTDWGVGVIKPNSNQTKFTCNEDIYNYNVFTKYRKDALNLISLTNFKRKVKAA